MQQPLLVVVLLLAIVGLSFNGAAVVMAQHMPMLHLTDATFGETVLFGNTSAKEDYFVLFYAPWCGNCKAVKPLFEDANVAVGNIEKQQNEANKKATTDRVGARFAMVDAVANTMLAKAYRIKSFPTFYYFMGGVAYKYDGPRDTDTFSFFARYLGIGRQMGNFAPVIPQPSHIRDIQKQAPSRVLSLLSSGCVNERKVLRPLCRQLVHSTLCNGKVHFAVLADEPSALFKAKAGAALPMWQQRIIDAFATASRGPDGEQLVALTDMFRDEDAVPFTGNWSAVAHQSDVGAAIQRGTFDAADPDVADEIMNMWSVAPKVPTEAVAFIDSRAVLAVDDGDASGIRAAVDRDEGKGVLAFFLVAESSTVPQAATVLRPISQRRNVMQFEARSAAAAAPELQALRPRFVTFFASMAATDLAAQLGVTTLPAFAVYIARSEMSCLVDLPSNIFTDAEAVTRFDDSVTALLSAIDSGDYSACSPTTLFGKIARVTTSFLPGLDSLLRDKYSLGNLEIVMLEVTALVILVAIPLALCRSVPADVDPGVEELAELRRLRAKAQRPKAE